MFDIQDDIRNRIDAAIHPIVAAVSGLESVLLEQAGQRGPGKIMEVGRRVNLTPTAAAESGDGAADITGRNRDDASRAHVARALFQVRVRLFDVLGGVPEAEEVRAVAALEVRDIDE